MNDLTPLPQNEPLARTTTLALSRGLTSLLTDSERSDEAAAQALAASPFLDEARVNLPLLRNRALAPAGEAGVREIVGKALLSYPQPDRGAAEWTAWWEPYIALCASQPLSALRLGMLEHMRGPKREWLPKAGDLLEISRTVRTPAAIAVDRIRRALDLTQPKPRFVQGGTPAPLTAEERQEAIDLAQCLAETLKAKGPSFARPPAQGAVGEDGLTDRMRALIGAQTRSGVSA
jgi:hypothetical protein